MALYEELNEVSNLKENIDLKLQKEQQKTSFIANYKQELENSKKEVSCLWDMIHTERAALKQLLSDSEIVIEQRSRLIKICDQQKEQVA